MIRSLWLNINKFCNFRCPWCYAKNSEYEKDLDMSFEFVKELIDFGSEIGVENISLAGGEPTCHKDFFEIVNYIKGKQIGITLITNGYLFHDIEFTKKVREMNFTNVAFSIKAGNKDQYKELAGIDAYGQIVSAINNLSMYPDINANYSITVTKENIGNIEELVSLAAIDKHRNTLIMFCEPSYDAQHCPTKGSMCEPREFVEVIMEKYDKLNQMTNGKIVIRQALPVCLWRKEFLDMLLSRGQLSFGCQIFRKDSIAFDTDGSLLICNQLQNYPVGKYGVDFKTKDQFIKFWEDENMTMLFKKMLAYPVPRCSKCEDYIICGGGCPLQWFVNNPQEIIPDSVAIGGEDNLCK